MTYQGSLLAHDTRSFQSGAASRLRRALKYYWGREQYNPTPEYGQTTNGSPYYPYGAPEQPMPSSPQPNRQMSRIRSRLRLYWRNDGPVITTIITVLCVMVWLVELYGYYLNPNFYEFLLNNGAFIPLLVGRKPWMYITSMFLHATNVTHILFNMLTLWAVGPVLERMMGHWRYLTLYLLSGVGGGAGLLVSAVIRPADWLVSAVGASGAIFGLFGAVLVVYRRSGTDIRSLLVFVGINLAMPLFVPGIAWQDHVGGFIVGMFFTLLLNSGARFLRGKSLNTRMWISGLLVLFLLLAVSLLCYGYRPTNGIMMPF